MKTKQVLPHTFYTIKRIFFFVSTMLSFPGLYAGQDINVNHHAPRPGDEIIKQQVQYKDPGRSGENILWDFGRLQPIEEEYTLRYHAPALRTDSTLEAGGVPIRLSDLAGVLPIVGTEHNTSYYYLLRNDSLLATGHRNATVDIRFHRPALQGVYPLSYGKETYGEYAGEGMYCERIPLFLEGNIRTVADAHGMMVLPSGDTLKNVLRVKTGRYIQAYAPAPPDGQPDTLRMHMETYLWYVKGYRYPVFETIRTFPPSGENTEAVFSTAFFYPPQQHYYLENDPENLALLFGEESDRDNGEEYPDWNIHPGETFACNFFPNPVRDVLTIEYYIPEGCQLEFGLYDLAGRKLSQDSQAHVQGGIYRHRIPMNHLQEDTYILKIKSQEKEISEIILKK